MKPAIFRTVLAIVAVAILASCAEGTAVVTGETRPPSDAEQVKLYSELPNKSYEVIGLVQASSANGWTDQQSLDYAITELKNQAAKIGANGVVISQSGSQLGGIIVSGNLAIPFDEQTISGTAVLVSTQ